MSFEAKPVVYGASIGEVTIGTGDLSLTIGGANISPLCFFEAPQKHPPAIGIEVSDLPFDTQGLPLLAALYEGCSDMAERVARAASVKGASFVCLRFESADPGGLNRSVADCVADAVKAAAASPLPIVIIGCKNSEKDTALFTAMAEALQGKNYLFLSAREEDYKAISAGVAMAYGHNVGAESSVDINLAKQLSVLMTQLGVRRDLIVLNPGSAAAGYGYEYVASTMDRIRAAALEQNDTMLQMPVITPVSTETWAVKESIISGDEMPEWGEREPRSIQMEIVTASACLASGPDAVIVRHPVSVEKLAALIAALL